MRDGLVIRPPRASTLRIVVHGLPAELPRERIGVWVRHEQRERLEGPRAALDAQGMATVPTPVAANYVLWLLVYPPGTGTPSSWRGVAIRPDPVALGADPPAEITWALDAATVALLRQALADK